VGYELVCSIVGMLVGGGKQQYTRFLFYAVIMFLKKWAQLKKGVNKK